MKYVVTVRGERMEVTLHAEGVEVAGARAPAELAELQGTPVFLLTLGDTVHEVVVRTRHARGHYTLWIDGFAYEVEALDERTRAIRDFAGQRPAATGLAPLVAPMPGLVVRINVRPGDRVKPGQGLVIIEAMKMENELRAHAEGTVKAVPVAPGTAVEKGTVLVELE